jgi:REP element-mobilizing transposase RayT
LLCEVPRLPTQSNKLATKGNFLFKLKHLYLNKIRNQTLPHFITTTVVDWIDVFTRTNYRNKVVECLDFCITNKSMILFGYVIMSNHIRMIVQSGDGKLSDLLRDIKKFTASKIIEKNKI